MVPTKIKFKGKEKIKNIATGFNHSIALAENGNLYTWGDCSFGKLGYSTGISTQNEPKCVSYLNCKNIIKVDAGPNQTVIVTSHDINNSNQTYNSIEDETAFLK